MKIRDKTLKKNVDVCDEDCPRRPCYWARPDPGSFTQGRGYSSTINSLAGNWLCGHREINGCPSPMPEPKKKSSTRKK
jgi:hypothetical protein